MKEATREEKMPDAVRWRLCPMEGAAGVEVVSGVDVTDAECE